MKKIYLLLLGIVMSLNYVYSQQSGGVFNADCDIPIDVYKSFTITYDATNSFGGWEPDLYIHIWLTAKSGETFSKSYETKYGNRITEGNDAIDTPIELKMDKENRIHTKVVTLKSLLNIEKEDIDKIASMTVIIHAAFDGDNNKTINYPVNLCGYTLNVTVKDGKATPACYVRGTWDEWAGKIAMRKTSETTFTVTLPSKPNAYKYYTNDDVWDNWGINRTWGAVDNVFIQNDELYWDNSKTPSTTLPQLNSVASLTGYEVSYYQPSDFSNVKELEITGTSDAASLPLLGNVLEANNGITSINFTGILPTSIETNYFENIANPNCLIYVPATTTAASWPNLIKKGETTNNASLITLADGYPFNCPIVFEAEEVSYTRDAYIDGGWETIILPFAPTANPADYQIESYSAPIGTTALRFTEINETMSANTPYIMKYTGETLGETGAKGTIILLATTATIQTAPIGANFVGTFTELDGAGKYFLNATGTAFGTGKAGTSVPPFRAYYSAPAGAPQRFDVVHGDDPTGFAADESITNNSIYSSGGVLYIQSGKSEVITIYGIDGRIVCTRQLSEGVNTIDGLAKGFYIVNNQKVDVK